MTRQLVVVRPDGNIELLREVQLLDIEETMGASLQRSDADFDLTGFSIRDTDLPAEGDTPEIEAILAEWEAVEVLP